MARIRTIKPEFWTDEKVVGLTPLARLLFVGLWNFCDDEGRMQCSPVTIKLQILPKDETDCVAEINELVSVNMVFIYEAEGRVFLQIVNFMRHQKVDKRTPSRFPAPPTSAESLRLPPSPPEPPRRNGMEGKGREGNGREVHLASLGAGKSSGSEVVQLQNNSSNSSSDTPAFPFDAPPATGVSIPTWSAYADAYRLRYGVDPVRNRTVNGQLAQLVNRLGVETAPAVAAFYVHHDFALYVRSKHPVNLLLRDAEGLHTEWRRGETVTGTEAAMTDRTAGTGNVFRRLIAELPADDSIPMAASGGNDDPY